LLNIISKFLTIAIFMGWKRREYTLTEATTGLLYKHQMMMDDDECATVGGIVGMGNRSTWRKPAPVPLCPPQIPHDLTRARIWDVAMGSQQLTT
jgi:hypothetical protein